MSATLPDSIAPLFRDLATGLRQQMFFWGKDVVLSDGNLFVRTGFHKRPSAGIQGTSCYSLPWHGGTIELHGTHAGWFGDGEGFLFVRPLQRCLRWLGGTPPAPGQWPRQSYSSRPDARMHALARPFLDWWLSHEEKVRELTSPRYREACYRHHRKLPGSRAWLTPTDSVRWVRGFRDDPARLPRARRFHSPAASPRPR